MKLSDLINSNHWLSVELTLLQLYPDQKGIIGEYRNVFEKLQQLAPEEYDMSIMLKEYDCDHEDESEIKTYVDVSGRKAQKEEGKLTDSYAIEFVEWKNWLGMDVAPETTKNFSDLEIIAHCLYEMTFIGYEENEIQEQFNTIKNEIEEYKNLAEEEKKETTISLDELMKQLKEKGSS